MGYRKDLQELEQLRNDVKVIGIKRNELQKEYERLKEEHGKEIFLKQSEIEANRMLLEILEDERKGLQDEVEYLKNIIETEEENVFQEFLDAWIDLFDNVFHFEESAEILAKGINAISDFMSKLLQGIIHGPNKFYKFITKKKGE